MVVDDDEEFLAQFQRLADRFNITTQRYISDALTALKEGTYCIVISDNRMREAPGMPEHEQAGLLFLEEVRKIRPEALRVLVTSWSKEGIRPSLSKEARVNRLIGKLEIITDEEWRRELERLIDLHRKARPHLH